MCRIVAYGQFVEKPGTNACRDIYESPTPLWRSR